ncbi:MAG: carboxypeptidase-like regulatory domain-containing protein, partial [Pyrinomonadaceae bacterium]
MIKKFGIISLLTAMVAVVGYTNVLAQTSAPVSGRVEVQKADGTKEPVAGALIEVYRTDIRTGFPSAKANKRGEFYLAGLLLGGEYAFAVSAPNTAPEVRPGIKAGQENVVITMSPGNGNKW